MNLTLFAIAYVLMEMPIMPATGKPLIDFTFHVDLGSLVLSVVGVLVSITLRRLYRAGTAWVRQFEQHGDILDEHSVSLSRAGWMRPDRRYFLSDQAYERAVDAQPPRHPNN